MTNQMVSDSEKAQLTVEENGPDDHNQMENTNTLLAMEELPTFTPLQAPNLRWGEVKGEVFAQAIKSCYEEIVH